MATQQWQPLFTSSNFSISNDIFTGHDSRYVYLGTDNGLYRYDTQNGTETAIDVSYQAVLEMVKLPQAPWMLYRKSIANVSSQIILFNPDLNTKQVLAYEDVWMDTEPFALTDQSLFFINSKIQLKALHFADIDFDGIDRALDNCPTVPNPTQTDSDGDCVGDLCDRDIDGDGVINEQDADPYDSTVRFDIPLPDTADVGCSKPGDQWGKIVLNIGNFRGDGVDDYLIASPNCAGVRSNNKGKDIKLKKAGCYQVQRTLGGNLGFVQGKAKNAQLGYAAASADITGEGGGDFAISAPWMNSSTQPALKQAGRVYVQYGRPHSNDLVELEGTKRSERFGLAIAMSQASDLDQPGWLAVASREAVYLYQQHAWNFIDGLRIELITTIPGNAKTGFGMSLAFVQHDDRLLLAIGEPKAKPAGAEHWYDVAEGRIVDSLYGRDKGEQFGARLVAVEHSANQHTLAISAPQAINDKLKKAGRVDLYLFGNNEALQRWYGQAKGEQLGLSLNPGAKQRGQAQQLLIGSPVAANGKLKQAGLIGIYRQNLALPLWQQRGDAARLQFGFSAAALDVTGDNIPEALVGSPGRNGTDKKAKRLGGVYFLSPQPAP